MTDPYTGRYPGATPGGTPPGSPEVGPMTTPITPTTTASPTEMRENYATDYAPGQAPPSGAMGMPTTEEGRPDVEGTSVGELIGEVTRDLSALMRQELELARAELTVEAKKAGQGAGMYGAAAFAGYMVLLFLSIALWWALSHPIGHSWSALVVAVLWGIVGAVAYVMGRDRFRRVHPKPERTVDTLQQVPSALKPN
jgi:Putative Actinobacterial Holin-X, holin superfamily III